MIRSNFQIVVMFVYFSRMLFENHSPSSSLKDLVKDFWVYENDDVHPDLQKIIPDGYSEIIIHYGDPYQIKMSDNWEAQSSILFSSQISNYFFLQNSGKSGMIGIKLHPATFYELFQLDIAPLTNNVISLENLIPSQMADLKKIRNPKQDVKDKIHIAQQWITHQLENREPSKMRLVVDTILEKNGLVDVDSLGLLVNLSTRQLERSFKKVIGLTPKFYSRIIRFNYIFEVMKEQNNSWVSTALQSGYFDQSHFIKNFKEFTGVEPSQYGFDEENLANFFLKR